MVLKIIVTSAFFWIAKEVFGLLQHPHHPNELIEQRSASAAGAYQGEMMPLVRIDLIKGKSPEYRATLGEVVYQSLVDICGVPKNDRFQVIMEHPKDGLQFDLDYLGIHRSDDCVFLQITLNSGRSVELKQRLYEAIASQLHQSLQLRREDVFINLIEVPKENWSYGNGQAQYVSPQI